MAPQVAQEGESPMSYMDFMASDGWYDAAVYEGRDGGIEAAAGA